MRTADELRDAVEAYLGSLALAPELGALEQPLRYSLESGGKRVRPLLCLAVAEANGASLEDALPAAAALELVTTRVQLAEQLLRAREGVVDWSAHAASCSRATRARMPLTSRAASSVA